MKQDELTEQLAIIIRDELLKNNSVQLDGLGTFYRKHVPAEEETRPDGTIILHPPKDSLEFEDQGAES